MYNCITFHLYFRKLWESDIYNHSQIIFLYTNPCFLTGIFLSQSGCSCMYHFGAVFYYRSTNPRKTFIQATPFVVSGSSAWLFQSCFIWRSSSQFASTFSCSGLLQIISPSCIVSELLRSQDYYFFSLSLFPTQSPSWWLFLFFVVVFLSKKYLYRNMYFYLFFF